MKLPIPSLFEKKEKQVFFLAALLRDDLIKVIIFEEIAGKIKVITQHAEHFPTTLEEAPIEEWVDTFDKAIGTVESKLPENAELKKTVFGVKQNWVDDAKIKKEYLQKLKKVSEELELQPIGFLIFSEAIIHLLQKEQGAPVSGILAELGKTNVIVSVIRAGKIIETKEMPVGDSPVQTVETALKHVTNVEILPSKIILFDGDNADTLSQEFISHPWNQNLPFLHIPQVSLLSPDFDAKAIMYGTGMQLGFEVLEDTLPKTTIIEKQPEEKAEKVAETQKAIEEEKPQILTGKDFGFVTDKDIVALESPVTAAAPVPLQKKDDASVEQAEMNPVPESEQSQKAIAPFSSLKTLFHIPSFKKTAAVETTPATYNNSSSRGIHKIVFIIPLLLLLFVGGIILYITEGRATVTLQINPKILSKTQDITFSTKENDDFSGKILHTSETTVSEDGSVSTDATGKKDTGTPAKGTVTIFNSSDSSKTLSAGTTLTSANGLKFTIDKDLTIASSSGDIFSGTKPGTADTAVTASDIGTDYNLPSNTKFSFSSNASIAAKNTNAFSGGTKKQITIVAKADIDKLQTDLEKSMESKAKDEMQKNTTADKAILPVILSEKITTKKTDKNIGDEAKTITLQGTVAYTGMSYDKTQFSNFAKSLFNEPTLSSQGITTTVNTAKVIDDHTESASIDIQASLTPVTDTKKIARDIKGKSLTQAKIILGNLPQVGNSVITFSPDIPLLPKILPMFENHIKVIVQTK